jgi:hypothetical protein
MPLSNVHQPARGGDDRDNTKRASDARDAYAAT